MMVPFPSLSQAYSLLVQEEGQRQVRTETHFLTENASFSVDLNRSSPTQEPWKLNHKKADIGKRSSLFCEHCKKTGHTMDKCYKLHGYPNKAATRGRGGYGSVPSRRAYSSWTEHSEPGGAPAPEPPSPALPGLSTEQSKQLYQFLSNLTTARPQKPEEHDSTSSHLAGMVTSGSNIYNLSSFSRLCKLDSGVWILDSGASDHMSYDQEALVDIQVLKQPQIQSALHQKLSSPNSL